MRTILGFFVSFAPLIYTLLVIGLAMGLRRLLRARTEERNAVYGLEQEIARRHMSQAVTTLSLVGFLAVTQFVLVVFLVPSLPAFANLATPTLNAFTTPTDTLSPEMLQTLVGSTPAATFTPQTSGCIPGVLSITSPKAGTEVKGLVELTGDANIPNFGFYKYEFAPLGSSIWSAIEASRTPVTNGKLGKWDTSVIAQGDYQLRLVITDNQGTEMPACIIPIRIKAP